MTQTLFLLSPELVLTALACVLFLVGCSRRVAMRRAAPIIALAGLIAAFLVVRFTGIPRVTPDPIAQIRLDGLSYFIRVLVPAVAVMLLLLAWPTSRDASGNSALNFGHDAGEFFAFFILSITGLLLTAVANDLIVLFLALELVSIPTYIMVSISRRKAAAQEAGVKYFFLGALSIALMLFGFSYLYGSTGHIQFDDIARVLQQDHYRVFDSGGQYVREAARLSSFQRLGVVMVLIGFAFKMAAFPLHFYAGDVYEGAATPVTAFLAFVPKTAGFVATIRLLQMVGGPDFALLPEGIVLLLAIIAALTMTIGNVLGLLQSSVKRVLAYSSIAHSGYMLVGLAAANRAPAEALQGVLFYLAAYGIMNAGAFGVLMLLPSQDGHDAAESYEDIAGAGRRHPGLGLAMAVSCFSLIGIPLTVGFLGKLMLLRPALKAGASPLLWLVIVLVINAAISAAYYLKIVASMFLRPEGGLGLSAAHAATADATVAPHRSTARLQVPILTAVLLSVVATLTFGGVVPWAAQRLAQRAAAPATPHIMPDGANITSSQPVSRKELVSR